MARKIPRRGGSCNANSNRKWVVDPWMLLPLPHSAHSKYTIFQVAFWVYQSKSVNSLFKYINFLCLLFHQHRLPLYRNTMFFCIVYVCTQIGLPFNPIEYLVCFSVDWLMSEIHELKGSKVAVDSATPKVCYNLICFLCWKIKSSLLRWY